MSTVEPVHALVFTPHPDDAEFGVAGTVVNWVREGKEVVYVVCTNGDKGTSDPDLDPAELARIREEEQLAAAQLLGVREVVFLRHPDQSLEDTPEFRKELVRLIRMYRPETVVTADCDLSEIVRESMTLDVSGHYSRRDLFQLNFAPGELG